MLQGIFPVLPTLFTDDDKIDADAQRSVVHFALDSGAHGIVFPGVASEYNFLTPAERGELIALVAGEINGVVPLVGGASAATAEEVIAAGEQAIANGIHHLMVMAPAGIGQDLDAQKRFFSQIAEALPDARLILQNAPNPIGAGLDAKSIIELAISTPSITYVKEETLPSGPAITAIKNAGIPHLDAVFGGGGARYLIDELDRGALGAMPAVELTDLHVAIWNTFQEGDHKRARELYRLSLPLLVCQAIYRMRFTKYLLERRGIASALSVRAPLPELDEFTRQDIDRMLTDFEEAFP
jgi:4-hydroxy-tetrahydrodipicolinate synthase